MHEYYTELCKDGLFILTKNSDTAEIVHRGVLYGITIYT